MKRIKTIGAALLLGGLFVAMSGCNKEGPMEQAGKEVDSAVEKAGDKIDKTSDEIKEAVQGDTK